MQTLPFDPALDAKVQALIARQGIGACDLLFALNDLGISSGLAVDTRKLSPQTTEELWELIDGYT